MVSIIILYYNTKILWEHRRICGPLLTKTTLCSTWLYVLLIISHKKLPLHKINTALTPTVTVANSNHFAIRSPSHPLHTGTFWWRWKWPDFLPCQSMKGHLSCDRTNGYGLATKSSGLTNVAELSVALWGTGNFIYKHLHTRHDANPHSDIMLQQKLTPKHWSWCVGHGFQNVSRVWNLKRCRSGK